MRKILPPPLSQPPQAEKCQDQTLGVHVKDPGLYPEMTVRAQERAQNKAPDFFGPPPLITGENVELYDALLQSVRDDVKPADVIEEILVRDFVNLVWEGQRWRRLNANLLSERAWNPARYFPNEGGIDTMWRDRLDGEARMSQALVENLDFVQRIDALTALAEARRSDVVREIDRHRATLGKRSRPAVQQVDGEYKVIGERPRQHSAEEDEAA